MGTPRSKKVSFDIASDVEGSKSNEKLLLYFFNGCAVYADGCAAYNVGCAAYVRQCKIRILEFIRFYKEQGRILIKDYNKC